MPKVSLAISPSRLASCSKLFGANMRPHRATGSGQQSGSFPSTTPTAHGLFPARSTSSSPAVTITPIPLVATTSPHPPCTGVLTSSTIATCRLQSQTTLGTPPLVRLSSPLLSSLFHQCCQRANASPLSSSNGLPHLRPRMVRKIPLHLHRLPPKPSPLHGLQRALLEARPLPLRQCQRDLFRRSVDGDWKGGHAV